MNRGPLVGLLPASLDPVLPERRPQRPDLKLVADDEPSGFRAVYDELYQPVANYLFRRLGDRHGTEDLLHDVFLAALRAFARFEHRGVPVRHWVFRIANHAASRWQRKQRRELRALARRAPRPATAPPGDALATSDDSLRALLEALPRSLQDAVTLHYLGDLPLADVAATLRIPVGTVKSRLSRARSLLRTHLDGGAR